MKFTTTSLLVAAVACSLQFSVRGGGAGFPKILVSAADAEKTNRNHGHLHASAIAAIAGNEVVEAFHRDLHQASRAIDQHKKARAQSLRVLGAEEDGDGMGKAELKKELKKCEAQRLAPSNLYVQTAETCRLRRRDDDTSSMSSCSSLETITVAASRLGPLPPAPAPAVAAAPSRSNSRSDSKSTKNNTINNNSGRRRARRRMSSSASNSRRRSLEPGTDDYEALLNINRFDVELYEYALELFVAQWTTIQDRAKEHTMS